MSKKLVVVSLWLEVDRNLAGDDENHAADVGSGLFVGVARIVGDMSAAVLVPCSEVMVRSKCRSLLDCVRAVVA